MADGRGAGIGTEAEGCRTKLKQIAKILTFPDRRITAPGLVLLRAKHREFGGTVWPESKLDPEDSMTWNRVLFVNNSLAKMSEPDEIGRRLELVLREFELVDFDFLGTEAPYDLVSWNLRLEEIRDYLLGKRHKNLIYLGTPAEAVSNLSKICKGATIIYNTVFTRSMPVAGHYETASEAVEAVKRELLTTISNCHWQDIVMATEEENFKVYRNKIEPPAARKRNDYRLIKHKLPLLQCLVFRRGDKSGAALVGWTFLGTKSLGRVYFSEHPETVEFFFEYCYELWEAADLPEASPDEV